MVPIITHRSIAADAHRVPPPFRAFAVRSDELEHAHDARPPYGCVHFVRTACFDAALLRGLAAPGWARVPMATFSDIELARTTLQELAAAAPSMADLAGTIAGALQATQVLGADPAPYLRSLATRIDYLASCRSTNKVKVAVWTKKLSVVLTAAS